MSYTDRWVAILAVWDSVKEEREEETSPAFWKAWDDVLSFTVELWDKTQLVFVGESAEIYGTEYVDMTQAEKLVVAGESWNREENAWHAKMLDERSK